MKLEIEYIFCFEEKKRGTYVSPLEEDTMGRLSCELM